MATSHQLNGSSRDSSQGPVKHYNTWIKVHRVVYLLLPQLQLYDVFDLTTVGTLSQCASSLSDLANPPVMEGALPLVTTCTGF